ncbi:MAG TPA: DUF6580 family putative transport protein [Pirellulales bacterium]
MFRPRFFTLAAMVFAAAAMRLLPHWPNFTPVGAIALFGGAYFASRRAAFIVPLVAMLISDVALMASPGFASANSLLDFFSSTGAAAYGWTSFKWVLPVYGCFVATVGIGLLLRRRSLLAAPVAALAASTLFFLVTNCSLLTGETGSGPALPRLAEGYIAGLPFFQNALLGDLFYTAILFGGFELAQRRWGALRATAAVAPAEAASA